MIVKLLQLIDHVKADKRWGANLYFVAYHICIPGVILKSQNVKISAMEHISIFGFFIVVPGT
jgi:hypothetical protein